MGATANKTKDFSAGDSFAKTFRNKPEYGESIGIEPAIVCFSYAGLGKEPVAIPFKNKVSKKPTINFSMFTCSLII